MENTKRFGTIPVFLTAVSTILGAILFLRFGFAVGMLGFYGVLILIVVGHLVTIPTAFAISEIATNQHVEGGGEYFIISRSFGLNIGGTIGIALFLSQVISFAFYIIAFTEAFHPFFVWIEHSYGIELPRQAVSIPVFITLSAIILKKGANIGIALLYIVIAILVISLTLFFAGATGYYETARAGITSEPIRNLDDFFIVFAIIFPAFTGMTAGVGLSGDLKNPGKSIPWGTLLATFSGFVVYIFIALKLVFNSSPSELINNQFVMNDVAIWGNIIIPLGLGASTLSSAIGSIMVAPRTLQALGKDRSLLNTRLDRFAARGKSTTNEPFNATLVTIIIAFVIVAIGNIDVVASIITMFFMVTYGSLCLISFLNHFGSSPSYRPKFRSHWLVSLTGFIASIYLMFKISFEYASLAIGIIVFIYVWMNRVHKERQGLEAIFRSGLFQINRNLQILLQRPKSVIKKPKWHPSVVCITEANSDKENAFNLLSWISYRYGFGTYIKFINGYYSTSTYKKSKELMQSLIQQVGNKKSHIYVDTIVSPSYTSAIAQVIQLPGISGMENNMALFEFDKNNPGNIGHIVENIPLVRAGNYDVIVMAGSNREMQFKEGIHIWIKKFDFINLKLQILLSHVIMHHPDWKGGKITVFNISTTNDEEDESRQELFELVMEGRLPISMHNIKFIDYNENINVKELINQKSSNAGLTMIGFLEEQLKHTGEELFKGYDKLGDVLFVSAYSENTTE